MESEPNEAVVAVRRQWNGWEVAKYRLSDLSLVFWDTTSGGVRAPAPQPFLHGYVQCDEMIEGDVAHSCLHGDGPHRIKVCVVKKDNDPKVFAGLVEQAGPKPPRAASRRRRGKRRG